MNGAPQSRFRQWAKPSETWNRRQKGRWNWASDDYARLCGRTLARAHARSGDAAV